MFYHLLLGLMAATCGSVWAANPLKINRMTPDGENVPPARQIVIQFNRPVVPLGRMERSDSEIPIRITPTVKCQWRWIDTSNLACQLGDNDNLAEATSYEIVIQPGIKAQDGATIASPLTHRFTTRRPDVTYVGFNTWTAPGMPYIQVTFNQPVSKKSVEEHLYFQTGASRVGPIVERSKWERTPPRYVWMPSRNLFIDLGEQKKESTDDQERSIKDDVARRVWMIHPQSELPGGSATLLSLEPGLVSAFGPEKGKDSRVLNQFHTYPEFRFLGIVCSDIGGNELKIAAHTSSQKRCDPLAMKFLEFSAPVIKEALKESLKVIPDLAGGTDTDPWDTVYSGSHLYQAHKKGATYRVPLPAYFKGYEAYHLVGSPKDEFGRSLPENLEIDLLTDHRKPNFEIIHHQSVIEKGVDTDLPIFTTNLKEITSAYTWTTASGGGFDAIQKSQPPEEQDISFAFPMSVSKMLKEKSGAVYGRVNTDPPVNKPYWTEHTFFSQVTPFQVTAKMGHFNSLVWVTDMRTGKPVKDATVEIQKGTYQQLGKNEPGVSKGKTDKFGRAMLDGLLKLDPQLEIFKSYQDEDEERFFVRVTLGEDMALLPLDRSFNIDPYRIGSYEWPYHRNEFGYIKAWGTTAQGLYRVGETIQYKIYVRDETNETLSPARLTDFKLEIMDPTGKSMHTEEHIQLNRFGSFSGEYKTPSNAIAGWYQFKLSHAKAPNSDWTAMNVLVTDFTPVPFRVENSLNGDLFREGDEIKVTTTARLHSGGPYTDASVRVNTRYAGTYFESKHSLAKDFYVQTTENNPTGTVNESQEQLNDKGELESSVQLVDVPIVYGKVTVESSVQDDRGKYVAASTTADYRGRTRYIGLRNTAWTYEQNKDARIEYLVMDERGNPVREKVELRVEYQKTTVSRVKGSGNAYLTHYNYEWVEVEKCAGESAEKDVKSCTFKPKDPGSYRITGTVKDTEDREHSTQIEAWVTGKGQVVWEMPDNNSLQVIAENNEPKIGDTVRYLVKNPYPGAEALISIERYGVIESWTETLESSTPIIEFKVKPHYMPGFYLSITVASKRAADSNGFGELDLGKPSFKMAYLRVPVIDPYKQIKVTAKSDREVYRPRDKVKVSLRAEALHPNPGGEPIELAVAVLDESVFDLVQGGKRNFDPYAGFYQMGSLDLSNFTTLIALLGRQKFEKKGANPGGGGGIDGPETSMRNLFKFVAYWNPSLETDKNGNATIEFELPDNLTGWRVLALASSPTDRLGLGDGNFKVNRPTEVRPVMPNQVTEGDAFKAGFSVMNRTDKARTLDVSIQASGNVKAPGKTQAHQERIQLEPYKRTTVWMELTTSAVERNRATEKGELKFEVTAGDSTDRDGLIHSVPVHKMRSLVTAANYGTTTEKTVEESILFPKEMHADLGSVSVTASPSVIANADGAFKYMRDYPYICWEQRLTKGVMAAHFLSLKNYLSDDFHWDEATGLTQSTLDIASQFQAPNGGMVYYTPQDEYVSPYLSAYTALAFNWMRDRGYKIPTSVESKLHTYLLDMLRRNVFPTFFTEGMQSSVRAVALAALARSKKITLTDLNRYAPHVKQMDLFGKAHFLQAAMQISGGKTLAESTAKIILNSADRTGGKLQFTEELDDSYTRILSSVGRSNCAILSGLSEYANTDSGKKLVEDAPFRLVRFITQSRGSRDYFENTQENMFCMNALVEYSKIYEKTTPNMTVSALLNGRKFGEGSLKSFKDATLTFQRGIEPSDPGTQAKVQIRREGNGRLYYATRVQYAPQSNFDTSQNAGIDVRREYSVERDGKWVLLDKNATVKRGEIIRVDLFVSLPAARNFVVVADPVPGGLEPINRDLANSSSVDADKGKYRAAGGSLYLKFGDWNWYNFSRWSFYHQEIRHHAVQYYSDYLEPGFYILSYTAQAIATGKFVIMPTHAEEMYDPDVFGKSIQGTLTVEEK